MPRDPVRLPGPLCIRAIGQDGDEIPVCTGKTSVPKPESGGSVPFPPLRATWKDFGEDRVPVSSLGVRLAHLNPDGRKS